MKRAVGWICVCLFLWISVAEAQDNADEKFSPLFNGSNLDGWVNVNGYPDTWTVRDGMIVCDGYPTGVLRTDKQYENFILELEFQHTNNDGNGGIFIHADALPARGAPFTRGIEIQVKVGNPGELFPIHGAFMVPDRPHPQGWMRSIPVEDRMKPVGEWNLYQIVSQEGMVSLAVNGKVVARGFNCNPRKGYIGLESENKSEVHYRNIRICELPSSNPPNEVVAQKDQGFENLSVDLKKWKPMPGDRWHQEDWILYYDGKGNSGDSDQLLWTNREYENFVLIADWRFPSKPETTDTPVVLPDGNAAITPDGSKVTAQVLSAGQAGLALRGSQNCILNLWNWPSGSGGIYQYTITGSQAPSVKSALTPLQNADNVVGQWNRILVTVIESQVAVEVNGVPVIKEAWLEGLPQRGPIALQHCGDLVLFTNVYVRELTWSEIFSSVKR